MNKIREWLDNPTVRLWLYRAGIVALAIAVVTGLVSSEQLEGFKDAVVTVSGIMGIFLNALASVNVNR